MKIYISGKITGLTVENYTNNFYKAEETLRYMENFKKIYIVNPVHIKPLFGVKSWFFYMCTDLLELRKCNHIAIQPNWMDSKGAFLEVFFAKFIFNHKIIWL
jgi:hypothetical protein